MSEFSADIGLLAGNPLAGAVNGLKVIDFSQIAAGPLCSMILADLGAVVIKVEPPEGDIARGLGPPFVNGESVLHLSLNRNKRSMVANLKDPADRARIMAMIADADIVIEGYRPGVAKRLGVGYDDVRAINPDVIYCSISAFGQRGPWSHKAGVDGVIQAASGLMSITGENGAKPSKVQAPVVDMVTGMQATIALLAAVAKRAKGEPVGHIDVNLYASAMILQQIPITSYLVSRELPERSGSGAPYATPNEAYATKDGYILIAAYQWPHWCKFCEAIGRPDLIEHPSYRDLPDRLHNRAQLTAEIESALRTQSTQFWLDALGELELTCAPIADYAMVAESAQLREIGALTTCDHAIVGQFEMPGLSIGGSSLPIRYAPPLKGEHDDLDHWPDA